MRLAYLVNTYPRVSHSFIRREILALEASGADVRRFSIRASDTPLVDEADVREQARTRVIFDVGAIGLLSAALRSLISRPKALLGALRSALRMSKSSDRGVLAHLAYLAEACVLREWLADGDECHVHAHFGTNSAAVAMLCRQIGGPSFSFTVHGPEEFERGPQLALAEKVAASRFVVAISEFGRNQLCRWSDPSDWGKLRVVHCGVDDRFLSPPLTPVPDCPRLICVGRLCVEKGHLVLIEAMRRLIESGVECDLVFAGDGPLRSRIERQIGQSGLRSRIRVTGWLSSEQVQREILAARAMVLPSFAEGLPVVIMEALALGRPVISTPVAGIPELLEPGISGWLVAPGSADQLAAAMAEALRTPVQRLSQMGQAGARAVAQRHNAHLEAAKLASLFRNGSNGHHH